MYNAAWYLIPICIFAIIIKSAWFKGVLGEWQVNLLIKLFLNKNKYHLIKNVTLPTFTDGKKQGTTQIDHIIVSQYGIFVEKTKNNGRNKSLSINQNFRTHFTKTISMSKR